MRDGSQRQTATYELDYFQDSMLIWLVQSTERLADADDGRERENCCGTSGRISLLVVIITSKLYNTTCFQSLVRSCTWTLCNGFLGRLELLTCCSHMRGYCLEIAKFDVRTTSNIVKPLECSTHCSHFE